jgi:phage tail sheath protein FI
MVPVKVGSMREFESFFGFPYENEIRLTISSDRSNGFTINEINEKALKYLLYYAVKIYFENGGGSCYIVSVGFFSNPQIVLLKGSYGSGCLGLLDGLNKVAEVPDVTLIVIPEAVHLSAGDYSVLMQSVLLQCSSLGNRFAILDLYEGNSPSPDLKLNRSLFGNKFLSYGSAYYPFLRTKMTQFVSPDCHNVSIEYGGEVVQLGFLRAKNSLLYKFVRRVLNNRFVVLPPSGAVAGVYVTTDKNRGPWKSPANIALKGVVEPVLAIDNQLYDLFNAGTEPGKSINNIRSFPGKGILVLGSRTLASNDHEGKYIPVSRFIIMVKETLKRSTSWVVFEPNDAVTWTKIRTIIENYLIQK